MVVPVLFKLLKACSVAICAFGVVEDDPGVWLAGLNDLVSAAA